MRFKGLGYSIGQVPKEYALAHLESVAKLELASNLLSVFCLAFTKASALFFYRRIFCGANRKRGLHGIIVSTLVLLGVWLIVYEFLFAFQCGTHFSAPWESTTAKYCDLSYPVLLSQSITNVVLDIWVVILPIYPVKTSFLFFFFFLRT